MSKEQQLIVVKGKVNNRLLKKFYQRSMDLALGVEEHTIHPKGNRFGASSSICMKSTLLGALVPELKRKRSNHDLRVFAIGHEWHDKMDRGVDMELWQHRGSIIRLSTFQLVCFPDIFEDIQEHEGVLGTPDHLLFFPEEKTLILNDGKSANDFSFGEAHKGTKVHHGIQVGTYLDGLTRSPIKDLIETCSVFMVHISKSSGDIKLTHADPLKLQAARDYWEDVAINYERYFLLNVLPGKVQPNVSWACNYCDFFKNWDLCSKCDTMEKLTNLYGELK